jgi:hypothetical protein
MTPQQKSEHVLAAVKEARRWFTRNEYCSMVRTLWTALDSAESASTEAQENAAPIP